MSNRSYLSGLLPCDGTFDMECHDWDQFLVASTYEPSRGSIIHRSVGSLVEYLASRGGTWWSHCGGQYDVLPIANEFDRRSVPCSIDYPRSRVTRLVGGGMILRDSYSLLPMRLERIAQLAGTECPELPWKCQCRLRCGGYCRLTRSMRDGDPDLDAYVASDARVLYAGLDRISAHAAEHGLALRGTLGSTAWQTAKRDLGLEDTEMDSQTWKSIREADYGGKTIVVRSKARGPGAHWDMSSAYPSALARCDLPVGTPRSHGHREAISAFDRLEPGVYRAVVDIPPTFLPPLPHRVGGKLTYPIGRVSGMWTLPELLAGQIRGVSIEKIVSATVWPRRSVIFAELMESWYAIRRKVGKQTPLGEWQRLLANSLTGKFAEGAERQTVRMHPKKIKHCPRIKACAVRCTRRCGAFRQLDRWGHLWGQPYYRMSPSSHVHWSAYLKAHTRIAWLTEAERHPGLVYGDTDSIWTTDRVRPTHHGSTLGAWELKHAWEDWECAAVKCYRFRSVSSGEITIRAAGARDLTDEEWRLGKSDQTRGVQSLLEAAQNTHDDATGAGLFRRRVKTWTMPGHDQQKLWYGDRKLGNDGRTYPVTVREHNERRKAKAKGGRSRGKIETV